jgi:hypothetical protein
MRITSIVIALSFGLITFGAGCADDGSEFGSETGGTWGAGAWELPPQVKRAFAQQYPGRTVAAWDRHNFEGGESVYDIVYHDQSGQSHSIRLSATGEVLPQPRPQNESQQQTGLAEQPSGAPGRAGEQQADVNEAR